MTRIGLNDSMQDVIVKMSDGNPGGLAAIMNLIKDGEAIDPQGAMGGLGNVLLLDTLGIYGTEIYVLHNDQCNRDTRELCMLLRAYQLGYISGERLQKIAGSQMRDTLLSKEEMDDLDAKVTKRLPDFQPRKEVVEVTD